MTNSRIASTVLVVAVVVFLGGSVPSSNDSVLKGEGNHLVPVQETQIDLRKEVLDMELKGSDFSPTMHVDVHFEFYNPGDARTVTVGFVTPPKMVPGRETEGSPIENFDVVMNGDSVSHAVQRLGASSFGEGLGESEDYVHHFEATFASGRNVLTHSYTYGGAQGSMGHNRFFYRLTTGTNWAGGTIDDFTLTLSMGEKVFNVTPAFADGAEEAGWDVVGPAKIGTVDDLDDGMLSGYTRGDGHLRFHKTDFAPARNLSIEYNVHPMSGHLLGPTPLNQSLARGESTLAEMYQVLIDRSMSTEEKMTTLRKRDASALRVLRNVFFAVRGYDFNDEVLQDRFEKYVWYVPDSKLDPASFDLSEKEVTWIKRLKTLEKQKRDE